MPISSTIDLIQTVNRSVSGVRSAPALAAYPLKADTASLPLVLTMPADGTWHHGGGVGGPRRQDRQYRIIVFVEPLGQAMVPTRLREAVTVMQALIEAWLRVEADTGANIALADPTGASPYQVTVEASNTSPQSDGGIVADLQIGGTAYYGFELRIRVRELW